MLDLRTLFVTAWVEAKHLPVETNAVGSLIRKCCLYVWTAASVSCTNLLPLGLVFMRSSFPTAFHTSLLSDD